MTIDELIEKTMKNHKCEPDAMECEIEGCDGCYVGLYWRTWEYDESIEHLVMQCCKCRDEIEI